MIGYQAFGVSAVIALDASPLPAPPVVTDPVYHVVVQSDWLDYLTAFGTVAAVLVALYLGLFDVLRWVRDERKRRSEEIRADAERVSAWTERSMRVQGSYSLREQVHEFVGVVANDAKRPIYEAAIEYESSPPVVVGFVAPGERVVVRDSTMPEGRAEGLPVTFRDAAGRWWHRTADGEIKPQDHPGHWSKEAERAARP